MKVMLLAYEAPEEFALRNDKQKFDAYMGEWYAFGGALEEAGIFESGAALEQPHAATTISVRNGRRAVEDGPYSDTKEQLGGFFIINVDSMDEAARWAARCPAAKRGFVDVRPVPYLEQENG